VFTKSAEEPILDHHRNRYLAERAVLLVTVFFETVNVVPAWTTSLPCVTRSVAKNQFGTLEDAMSIRVSVA
jgi:hypothetical protein